jgi:hypothetical protein
MIDDRLLLFIWCHSWLQVMAEAWWAAGSVPTAENHHKPEGKP